MDASGFFNIAGRKLEYAVWPGLKPSAPAFVLLHEGLGCLAMWKDFPARLAAASGHPVLAYSRAGYGNSSPVDVPRPLSYMHDEANTVLPALLDAAGFDAVILLGHSDGASIAAIYAGAHDDPRIAGLVLMAPHFFVEDISVTSIAAARDAYQTGSLRAGLEKYHGRNTECAFWGWNRAWLDAGFLTWDITEFLPGIAVPVLGVQGRDDQYGTLAQLETLKQQVPSPVTHVVLNDCGHSPHRDQPDEVLFEITEFSSRLTTAAL